EGVEIPPPPPRRDGPGDDGDLEESEGPGSPSDSSGESGGDTPQQYRRRMAKRRDRTAKRSGRQPHQYRQEERRPIEGPPTRADRIGLPTPQARAREQRRRRAVQGRQPAREESPSSRAHRATRLRQLQHEWVQATDPDESERLFQLIVSLQEQDDQAEEEAKQLASTPEEEGTPPTEGQPQTWLEECRDIAYRLREAGNRLRNAFPEGIPPYPWVADQMNEAQRQYIT